MASKVNQENFKVNQRFKKKMGISLDVHHKIHMEDTLMKDQNYITIRIPKCSIRFSDPLKDKCFHDQSDQLSDGFEDDLVKQLEDHFSNMEMTIS